MAKTAKYGLVLVAVAALLGAILFAPLNQALLGFVEWMHQAGGAGVAVYSLVYVLATLLLLPGSVLTWGAGFVYGPTWGPVLVSPVSVVAATLAFTLGRFALRDWIANRLAKNPRFGVIDRAVGARGFKIVFLLRLSPIVPYNLLNYALGLTSVKLRDYVLASFLGMLPGTFLNVYLGSLVRSVSELASGKPGAESWSQIFYWVGLVAAIVVTIFIMRIGRRALREELEGQTSAAPGLSSDLRS